MRTVDEQDREPSESNDLGELEKGEPEQVDVDEFIINEPTEI
jgi:hypothetical protein